MFQIRSGINDCIYFIAEMCIRDSYTAVESELQIPLMKGISDELMQVNTRDDIKRWWEVVDRSTGQVVSVSYTHLDVYKRQDSRKKSGFCDDCRGINGMAESDGYGRG